MSNDLSFAVRQGRLDTVRALLDRGAEPNQTNFYGDSLVDMARDRGHHAVAMLLEQACERGRRVRSSHTRDDSEIHRAAEAGDVARVRTLVDADPKLVRRGDRAGGTPLHRAVIGQSTETVRLLLARGGLDPDYPTLEGITLLHALCSRDVRGRTMRHRTECAALLLDAGANISARDAEYVSTPLAWAARNDLADMVEFLLERGAPPNLPGDEPWAAPLAWAARRGHSRIVSILRQHGAQ